MSKLSINRKVGGSNAAPSLSVFVFLGKTLNPKLFPIWLVTLCMATCKNRKVMHKPTVYA